MKVTKKRGKLLTFDVMLETIEMTTMKYLKEGSEVNLERSLKVSDRIDGHFVQGHIEGVGTVTKLVTIPNYVEYWITIPKKLMRYVVVKGSVCFDGISLTVGRVKKNSFSVYIIPHTHEVTKLRT